VKPILDESRGAKEQREKSVVWTFIGNSPRISQGRGAEIGKGKQGTYVVGRPGAIRLYLEFENLRKEGRNLNIALAHRKGQ